MFYSAEKKRGIERHAPAKGLQAVSHAVAYCRAASLQYEKLYASAFRERVRETIGSKMYQKSPN